MKMLKSLLDTIYPRFCLLCEDYLLQNENIFCSTCQNNIKGNGASVVWNLYQKGCFLNKYALFPFNEGSKAQKLVHAIKYEGNIVLAGDLGLKLGEKINEEIQLIIPVPLHRKKRRRRGFNQSEEIAKGISEVLQCPVIVDQLIRKKHSTTQTKMNRKDRYQNIEGVFVLKNEELFIGKSLLLVDDVFTTGATSYACAEILQKANPKSISLAVIGKAD